MTHCPPVKCYIRVLRPLSITHVDTELAWRGGQQSLLTLALALRERNHVQTIVCPLESELAKRARSEGLSVATNCSRTSDIVHSHSGRAQNKAYWETLGSRVARVVTRHVAFEPRSPLIHRIKHSVTCNGIIAVSNSVREILLRTGVAPGKIQVIHTGITMPEALPTPAQRASARERFHLRADTLVIGHMGAFTAEKGQDIAVAAARELETSLPQARLLFAGEGPMAAELRNQAPANVHFLGFVENRSHFFAALDLFIMPSRSEAWGLAALEAMSYGVPVIASDIGGLHDIVEPGKNGWLVASGDTQSLANAIGIAAANPALRLTIGQSAHHRAAQFSIQHMAEQTERFYLQLLG